MKKFKFICALSLSLTYLFSSTSFDSLAYICESEAQFQIYKKSYTKAPNPLKSDPKLYPLTGRVEYGVITRELLDQCVAEGEFYVGRTKDGYKFNTRKRPEDLEIAYKEQIGKIDIPSKMTYRYIGEAGTLIAIGNTSTDIYLDLAGLYDGELSEKAKEVRNIIADFLNSFDFRNASDQERLDRMLEFAKSKYKYGLSDEEIMEDKEIACANVWGVLTKGKAVCSGDSKTLQLLANCVGLKSIAATNGGHDWNYIEVDDKWYRITAGFKAYIKEGESTDEEVYNIKYTIKDWELE